MSHYKLCKCKGTPAYLYWVLHKQCGINKFISIKIINNCGKCYRITRGPKVSDAEQQQFKIIVRDPIIGEMIGQIHKFMFNYQIKYSNLCIHSFSRVVAQHINPYKVQVIANINIAADAKIHICINIGHRDAVFSITSKGTDFHAPPHLHDKCGSIASECATKIYKIISKIACEAEISKSLVSNMDFDNLRIRVDPKYYPKDISLDDMNEMLIYELI